MTLIELLVATAMLTVVVGCIGGAFAIGYKVLGPGGAQSYLTGAHDLLSFEQQLGGDIARAACLAAPGQTSIPVGGCTASVQRPAGSGGSTCASGYVLCLAWYQPGSATCHTVSYTRASQSNALHIIVRTDSAGASGRLTSGAVAVTATWTAGTTTNNGYQWTSVVNVSVTQQGESGSATTPVATQFRLTPLIQDPLSPVAGGTGPC